MKASSIIGLVDTIEPVIIEPVIIEPVTIEPVTIEPVIGEPLPERLACRPIGVERVTPERAEPNTPFRTAVAGELSSPADVESAIRRFQEHNDPDALHALLLTFDWVAVACARRMQRRGEPIEDLQQVAREALIGAAARFDVERGIPFKSFAWATATGALQHHYRSRWQVRVPRRLQELHLAATRASVELQATHGHDPTAGDVAEHLGISQDEAILALDVGHAYSVDSLDHRWDEETAGAVERVLGSLDPCIETTAERVEVRAALQSLPAAQRTALTMLFYEGRTQSEVGTKLGVSQAQVSRLMRAGLKAMRARFESREPHMTRMPQAVGA